MEPRICSPAYAELLSDLFARRRFGVELGLERVARVAVSLGWADIPVVRVAGTNGKGSTCAFIDAALRASGVRTGRFSSPHLCRFTERFHVAGVEAGPDAVVAAAGRVAAAGGGDLTFFEMATAIALALFQAERVDIAILEVGLGGRLDATRAIEAQVAAVTRVAMDHQRVLGDTLEAIAREKAGTFAAGKAAIIGTSGRADIDAVLTSVATEMGAEPIVVVGTELQAPLGLAGRHQRHNAAVALAVLEELARLRLIGRARERWLAAFRDTKLPGRLEVLGTKPTVIVDGGHNPDATRALAAELVGRGNRVLSVIGVSADKDVANLVAPIVEVSHHVWVSKARHPRAMSVPELAEHVPAATPAESIAEGLEAALRMAHPGDVVVVCGSLFAAGEARAHLTGELCDPPSVTDP